MPTINRTWVKKKLKNTFPDLSDEAIDELTHWASIFLQREVIEPRYNTHPIKGESNDEL